MCKQSFSTTTMDLVLALCAAAVVAPSMPLLMYSLSKRKKRSTIGKNIQKNSTRGRRGVCSTAFCALAASLG